MGLSSDFVYHVYVCVIKLYCMCWNTWRVRSLKMWEIVLGHWRRWGVSKGCQSLQWVGDASGWTSSCSHRGRCIPRERICPLHQNHLFKAQRFKIQNPTDPSIKLAYICLFFRTWFEGWFLSNADVYEYILLKKIHDNSPAVRCFNVLSDNAQWIYISRILLSQNYSRYFNYIQDSV